MDVEESIRAVQGFKNTFFVLRETIADIILKRPEMFVNRRKISKSIGKPEIYLKIIINV